MNTKNIDSLIEFLKTLPAIDVNASLESGSACSEGKGWWVKFIIDEESSDAWQMVKDLAHVLNYKSKEENVPVRFWPVYPTICLGDHNPHQLRWVIECLDPKYSTTDFEYWFKSKFK